MVTDVLPNYDLEGKDTKVESYGSGLINRTWKVTTPEQAYILQQVNESVFARPEDIAHNLRVIAAYLQEHHPEYLFVAPLRNQQGSDLVCRQDDGVYRLFPFVPASHSLEVVENPTQAYEAARQFGRFTRLLSGLDATQLRATIPRFHDLTLRYEQFRHSLRTGQEQRLRESRALIDTLEQHVGIVRRYEAILRHPAFRVRITHHDTKISNVLFDPAGKGLCVVDLDTVMPGYFISDVGDMMRTYLSPVSEEERQFDLIEVRSDYYQAIVDGYLEEMQEELSGEEKRHFFYAGTFMIYMQALRFLTDHLNSDRYYGARYPGHNYVRAQNQVMLLHRLLEKEPLFTGNRSC